MKPFTPNHLLKYWNILLTIVDTPLATLCSTLSPNPIFPTCGCFIFGHLRFALPGLNALFLHGQRSGHLQREKQHTLVERTFQSLIHQRPHCHDNPHKLPSYTTALITMPTVPLERFYTVQRMNCCLLLHLTHRLVGRNMTGLNLGQLAKEHIWTSGPHGVTYPMQLHVEATGVTHRLSLSVTSPQCGGAGVAVSAAKTGPARCGLLQREKTKTLEWKKVDFWWLNPKWEISVQSQITALCPWTIILENWEVKQRTTITH